VALLSEATTPRQRRTLTTLAAAAAVSERADQGPTLIVIGPVVGLSELLSPWQQTAPAGIADAAADRRAAQL
jgi:siroheme synthase